MARYVDEDNPWAYTVQVPIGWGVRGDKDDPDYKEVFVVMYLDDHLEVHNTALCNKECDRCERRIDCLVHNPSLDKVPYVEPLGFCGTDTIEVDPYECTMWCQGGLESGSYPWPV